MNIDLKSFGDEFYREICGGISQHVKNTIEMAAKSCHVEVTTLIIPGLNDSEEEMEELASWLSSVSPRYPSICHVSSQTIKCWTDLPLRRRKYIPWLISPGNI